MVRTFSGVFLGLETLTIDIEIDIRSKLKSFDIIGLPSTAVKESSKRVEAAIVNSGFHFPGKQIVVNLAPAGVRKIGTLFDLAIAIGIIANESEIELGNDIFMIGELSLDGRLKPINGTLVLAGHAKEKGFKTFICPKENAQEAGLIENLDIIPVESLSETVMFLNGKKIIEKEKNKQIKKDCFSDMGCFSDVKGQESAKRALEISASGGHNILMFGPPGTGKTMLARRLLSILPMITQKEALDTSKIHSVSGILEGNTLINQRPFRSPHHTASDISIVGGGRFPRPGEISLSHNGILFLDEMQEFKSSVIQALRQPLEEKKITISRAEGSIDFPANFLFVGAMNPCKDIENRNSSEWNIDNMNRLVKKFSHPFLDRIDMHIQIGSVPYEKIERKEKSETSENIKKRVENARNIQRERFKNHNILTNSEIMPHLLDQFCELTDSAKSILKLAMNKLNLSLRSYDKIIKCARTIADLSSDDKINDIHISEALQYRVLDRILYK